MVGGGVLYLNFFFFFIYFVQKINSANESTCICLRLVVHNQRHNAKFVAGAVSSRTGDTFFAVFAVLY